MNKLLIEDFDINVELNKLGDKWIDYPECEQIAFKLLFPKGFEVLYKDKDNGYEGKTTIRLKVEVDEYDCEYWWGSCPGCDTLEGSGSLAAVKMIINGTTLHSSETSKENKN